MENKEIVKILEAHKEWIEHPEKSKGKVNELILAQAIGIVVNKLNLFNISAVGRSACYTMTARIRYKNKTINLGNGLAKTEYRLQQMWQGDDGSKDWQWIEYVE